MIGLGTVGLATALHLAARHRVRGYDIAPSRVAQVRTRSVPGLEPGLAAALADPGLSVAATADPGAALAGADLVLVAVPTDPAPGTDRLDTRAVADAVALAGRHAPGAAVALRSTLPVGFTRGLMAQTGRDDLLAVPEFLRQNAAMADMRAPARIVAGGRGDLAARVAALLAEGAGDPPIHLTGPDEAEAIKLWSNAQLAMRVAFWNELDGFALDHGLDPQALRQGVAADPRIGGHHARPSFGFGGACLPKDVAELAATAPGLPLLAALGPANAARAQALADQVAARAPSCVGVLAPAGRADPVLAVAAALTARGVALRFHAPPGAASEPDLAALVAECDLILSDRRPPDGWVPADRLITREPG